MENNQAGHEKTNFWSSGEGVCYWMSRDSLLTNTWQGSGVVSHSMHLSQQTGSHIGNEWGERLAKEGQHVWDECGGERTEHEARDCYRQHAEPSPKFICGKLNS